MCSVDVIVLSDFRDVQFAMAVRGAVYGNTKMPSGLYVPRPPKGKGYYAEGSNPRCWLRLRDLEALCA